MDPVHLYYVSFKALRILDILKMMAHCLAGEGLKILAADTMQLLKHGSAHPRENVDKSKMSFPFTSNRALRDRA